MSYRDTDHLRVPDRQRAQGSPCACRADRGCPGPRSDRARDRCRRRGRGDRARERPDVALVGLGESSQHALDLIDKIVHEAACPVIVLLHARDPAFIKEASKRGVFAHISDADVEDWQSSIDIVLRRFAEYHALEGAFGRRALIERAKGILTRTRSAAGARAIAPRRRPSPAWGCRRHRPAPRRAPPRRRCSPTP